MKNTIELAAEFIHRAAFVDANALLKDEGCVEYKKLSQVEYYALFKDLDDSKALKHAAECHLKRLNDQKFEPYVVEYNLKEN